MGQVGTETKCVSVCVCVLVHVCVTERERGGELRAHRMGVREGGRCREWHQREGGVQTSGGWEDRRGGVGDGEGKYNCAAGVRGFPW